ncbi:hypothetical protein ANME2D_01771 [Candidatus Methanoperedens nitroreducens]|uniref:Uncharacterized protein n=1 Tax=Candidatus Methanoperedens nitratireducens TaxID=1392998 RepID=A0A062V2W7_9EURY|nr:hypothetical protein [Candidatus Methanoperedens nitroreducens]KCZ71717.1 hypothetical protein ANME2D_01771 [Candidatus Methanoperedens nitroreducens]MDJ1422310.1 hypothetical protein [Candidatus Methanoperedens sp.]
MSKLFNEMEDFDKIEKKISGWTLRPVDKEKTDPLEMVDLNSGYAVEQYQWDYYHQAFALTQDRELQKLFARISLEEEEHVSILGSIIDPKMTYIESGIALQMTAIQGFTEAAQLEPDESLRNAYNYMLLDHLTQMRIFSDTALSQGTRSQDITKDSLRIMEGRPFEKQFIPTEALLKQPLDKDTADIMSFVNAHTILANETQLRNDLQMFRKTLPAQDLRRLFNMVAAVENLHILMLESLLDPAISPLEYAMINELMEIRKHNQGMQSAKHKDIRSAHEYTMKEDEVHLSLLMDAYSSYGPSDRFELTDRLFAQPEMSTNKYINHFMDQIHQAI